MNVASCQILSLWHNVLNLMLYSCREVSALLRASWEKRMSEQWSDVIVKYRPQDNVMIPTDDLDEKEPILQPLNVLERAKREQNENGGMPALIEDVTMCSEPQPRLWEQRYRCLKSDPKGGFCIDTMAPGMVPSAPKDYRGVHMFVLVHGFQGNSFDMRLFKNNLALVYPDAIFMVSSSNEDNTDGDLNEMGIRLAQEVTNFVADWCPGSSLGRLSFVGYSIGGVIVRSALPHLREFHSKFHTYLSLSVAHFGFMDQQSPLFNSAVWMLTKWKKCTLLEQLALRDAPDLKDTYLAKLCTHKGLEHFKWIALVSSKQDNYSPSKSSRMEMDPAWEKSPSKDVYTSMVRSLWEGIDPERVLRIRAHFNLPEKNVDAMIGRVAHIRFIECQPIMRMLIHSYSFLFR
jgi:pimeloyl-ACP methyl ester carboxylesterase